MPERRFYLTHILAVIIGWDPSIYRERGCRGLLEFMTGRSLEDSELDDAASNCRKELLRQFPDLKGVQRAGVSDRVPSDSPRSHSTWLAQMTRRYGSMRYVSPI